MLLSRFDSRRGRLLWTPCFLLTRLNCNTVLVWCLVPKQDPLSVLIAVRPLAASLLEKSFLIY